MGCCILSLIIVQKPEIKLRAFSIQSPAILPRQFPESPAVFPSPFNQFEDGYSLMERRKSSIANEADFFGVRKITEDQPEPARITMAHKASLIPFELDADRFKRPKELKSEVEDKSIPNFQTKLVSPVIQAEERKEGIRSVVPLGLTLSPILIKTPLLNSLDGTQWAQPALYGYPAEVVRKNSEYGFKLPITIEEGLQANYFYSPFPQASPILIQSPQQMVNQNYTQHDNFRLDNEEGHFSPKANAVEPMIGALTVTQRKEKIKKYREKRKQRIWRKKISYDCRKKVADKRLRIKGRFVTREQAYSILGTTAEDLASNELLRTLITNNGNCSIITSAQNMKIRNIQTLLSAPDRVKVKSLKDDKTSELKNSEVNNAKTLNELKVEILKNNSKEHVVEIKIEPLHKNKEDVKEIQQKKDKRLPQINNPIFQFKRLTLEELNPQHSAYHKEIKCL